MRARGRSAESGFPDRELVDRGPLAPPPPGCMLINSGITGEQLRQCHLRRRIRSFRPGGTSETNGDESRSAFWLRGTLSSHFPTFSPFSGKDSWPSSSPPPPRPPPLSREELLPLRQRQVSWTTPKSYARRSGGEKWMRVGNMMRSSESRRAYAARASL